MLATALSEITVLCIALVRDVRYLKDGGLISCGEASALLIIAILKLR
jgi:hypothetical protein